MNEAQEAPNHTAATYLLKISDYFQDPRSSVRDVSSELRSWLNKTLHFKVAIIARYICWNKTHVI